MRSLLWLVPLLLALAACQTEPQRMSVDEAKKITAAFPGAGSVPPPRTITDITAILDQQKPDESYRAAVKARLDETPPLGASATLLTEFYARRPLFALQAGRGMQAVAHAREGVRYGQDADYQVMMLSLSAQSGLDVRWRAER